MPPPETNAPVKVRSLDELPEPDSFGNFWFGPSGCSDHPAIFWAADKTEGGQRGWIASRGKEGMIWDGAELKRFASPGDARKAMRKLAGGRGR